MFRYTGPKRTYQHNLRLAIVLSAAAGFVNAAGLVAFSVLTTNITGHAAALATDASLGDWEGVRLAAWCLFLFFAGALLSASYINFKGRNKRFAYTLPLLVEVAILVYVALYAHRYDAGLAPRASFAGSLLFAMGMQNALVTMVSRSVVRTTHLTGMVTDFGIAVADALRRRFRMGRMLRQRLLLHISIIFFFCFGGMVGVFFFMELHYYSFLIPAVLVVFAMVYDALRTGVLLLREQMYLLRERQIKARRPLTDKSR